MQKVRVGLEKVQLGSAGAGSIAGRRVMLPRVTFRMLQMVTEDGKGFEAGEEMGQDEVGRYAASLLI
jgi:hypothetical protein